jgi:VWFA-related protein
MAFRKISALFLLMSLVPMPVRSQEETDAKLVNLNVVAVDNHGRPVNDLTADDFRITDDGKPQKIVFFRHKDSTSWQAPAGLTNPSSNRIGAKFPYATVILFDLLNESFGTRGAARVELERYLESLENADYLYLYGLTLEGRLYIVHGLREDTDDIAQPGAEPWTRRIKPIMDRVMNIVTITRPVDIDVAVRVQLTYNALSALGLQLSGIPGRKNIVWITDGVPIELGPRRSDTGDFVDFTPLLRQMSDTLDRSGVSIYPVRQIMLGSPNDVGGSTVGDGIGSIATLDEFAGMTGGRPDAGKDIAAAVKQAMADVRTSYQLAYYPSSSKRDGKLHKLRVTSSRKGGVRLQTRTGYYASVLPPGGETRQAIDSLVATKFDAAEIGLTAGWSPDSASPAVARFDVRIDARDIALAGEAGQYTGQLRIASIVYFADGHTRGPQIFPLDVHYNSQQRDQVLKAGIPFSQTITLSDDVKAVRFIVYDRGSNQTGSVTLSMHPLAPGDSK